MKKIQLWRKKFEQKLQDWRYIFIFLLRRSTFNIKMQLSYLYEVVALFQDYYASVVP